MSTNTLQLHDALDQLWRDGTMTRHAVYAMLAAHLCLPADGAHISKLTENQRTRALEFLRQFGVALVHQKRVHPGGVEARDKPLSSTLGERTLAKGARK
jgi:hypothetical protein